MPHPVPLLRTVLLTAGLAAAAALAAQPLAPLQAFDTVCALSTPNLAGWRDEVAAPAFVVKTRGTDNCRDSLSGATVCGPWSLRRGQWHHVNVRLRPSLRERDSDLQVWLDGRACPQVNEFADLVIWHADPSGQLAWGLLAQSDWAAADRHR